MERLILGDANAFEAEVGWQGRGEGVKQPCGERFTGGEFPPTGKDRYRLIQVCAIEPLHDAVAEELIELP
jgi:hypothetical protein